MGHFVKALSISAVALITQPFFSSAALAQTQRWKLDTAHSSAGFAVRHMMVSNVRGRFPKLTGNAEYDGKDIKSINVEAVIDTSSIDTGDDKRDEHLRGEDFFNIKKFPQMKFVSKKTEKAGKGHFKLIGDLTLCGITKPVTLDVEGPSDAVEAMGKTRVGASATTTINRKDFGITYGGLLDNGGAVVSDDVKVTLDIELVKQEKAEEKASAK
ncbi:MAG: YceI family protein [Candidatus Obscuribacterales bacterium]|nr:YceI family protein [Candidatus Obscuribacterales bacterium]